MEYLDMLKRVKKTLPYTKSEGRLEIPQTSINVVKRTTTIRNFTDISKSIRRDEKHFAKFLFKELAVPGTIANGELIFNAKISPGIINQRIQEYISEFVLCKECGKPDTNMTIESGIAVIKCEACGARRTFKV